MKYKHHLSVAALVMAGFVATGCSQQQITGGGSSQVAGGSQVTGGSQMAGASQSQIQKAPETKVVIKERVVVKQVPARRATDQWGHVHPAIPNCTDSIRHSHKYQQRNHTHRYSCRGGKRMVKRSYNKWTHTHPAIPNCTNSITHTHKFQNRNHSHHYSCKGMMKHQAAKPPVDVFALQRKLKAKGYYKGPIDGVVGAGTRSALQQFMQNRR